MKTGLAAAGEGPCPVCNIGFESALKTRFLASGTASSRLINSSCLPKVIVTTARSQRLNSRVHKSKIRPVARRFGRPD